jgi:hypothetical protein
MLQIMDLIADVMRAKDWPSEFIETLIAYFIGMIDECQFHLIPGMASSISPMIRMGYTAMILDSGLASRLISLLNLDQAPLWSPILQILQDMSAEPDGLGVNRIDPTLIDFLFLNGQLNEAGKKSLWVLTNCIVHRPEIVDSINLDAIIAKLMEANGTLEYDVKRAAHALMVNVIWSGNERGIAAFFESGMAIELVDLWRNYEDKEGDFAMTQILILREKIESRGEISDREREFFYVFAEIYEEWLSLREVTV